MLTASLNENTIIEKLTELSRKAMEYAEQSKSVNTRKAYETDWAQFKIWCEGINIDPLYATPEILGNYVSFLAETIKYSSIKRKVSSISQAFEIANLPNPTKDYRFHAVMDGIGKVKGKMQKPREAILLNDIQSMINCVDVTTLTGKRDKALLLIGFASAARRSELVNVDLEDITLSANGMDIIFKVAKTDETINKSIVYAHNQYCPIEALKEWLRASKITSGAIFRRIDRHGNILDRLTDQSVALIVKKYAEMAGLDARKYSGHSLRSGLATSAAEEGMNESSIMHQTGHKSRTMVDRYVQKGNRYKNNASSILSTL